MSQENVEIVRLTVFSRARRSLAGRRSGVMVMPPWGSRSARRDALTERGEGATDEPKPLPSEELSVADFSDPVSAVIARFLVFTNPVLAKNERNPILLEHGLEDELAIDGSVLSFFEERAQLVVPSIRAVNRQGFEHSFRVPAFDDGFHVATTKGGVGSEDELLGLVHGLGEA
jgi:hypothetical protein